MTGTDQNIYIYLFYGYESTLRYYWTYTYFIDTGVPVGTTEPNQRQDLFRNGTYLDTGVPVGTTELIQR